MILTVTAVLQAKHPPSQANNLPRFSMTGLFCRQNLPHRHPRTEIPKEHRNEFCKQNIPPSQANNLPRFSMTGLFCRQNWPHRHPRTEIPKEHRKEFCKQNSPRNFLSNLPRFSMTGLFCRQNWPPGTQDLRSKKRIELNFANLAKSPVTAVHCSLAQSKLH